MTYYSNPPEVCAICRHPFGSLMFDARHPHDGRWGNFCLTCFTRSGATLGQGRGQRYELQPNGRYLKTGG